MNMDNYYFNKYLKYKNKYLELKGGGNDKKKNVYIFSNMTIIDNDDKKFTVVYNENVNNIIEKKKINHQKIEYYIFFIGGLKLFDKKNKLLYSLCCVDDPELTIYYNNKSNFNNAIRDLKNFDFVKNNIDEYMNYFKLSDDFKKNIRNMFKKVWPFETNIIKNIVS